ncbi:BnaCnng78270D [Brassica napus]|uniref:BnaCnng78270D protein n=1 Tax=Brassica napus TaxID=3708 RepID=A0A078JY04_BRANA|nr:BnaCnng78270D [Brassica napus]
MKLYLWDQAAVDFCKKFKSSDNTPSVILVTTVYPKRLGGTVALTSMTSSRVFLDYDVQPTKEYIGWYVKNLLLTHCLRMLSLCALRQSMMLSMTLLGII